MADRMEDRALRTSAEGAAVLAAVRSAAPRLAGRRIAAVITGDAQQWERHAPATEEVAAPDDVLTSYLPLRDRLLGLGLEPA